MSRLFLDLQGAQSSAHRDRGVARYVVEQATGVERVAPGRVHGYLVHPGLAPPGGIEALVSTGRVVGTDEVDARPGDIVHLLSPIELGLPLDEALPRPLRRARLLCTLYDLIPDVLADRYLADAGQRRRWRSRVELLRQADHLLAISHQSARDAEDRLGVPATRITTIGGAASAHFRPPADREQARVEARRRIPGLRRRWVLYTGGTDERKNMERLLEAWALLAPEVRTDVQLVLVCSMPPLARNHYEVLADRLGFADGMLIAGFVPEDVLVLLNQGAELAVFPSLYEGFGLPVAEAHACGTPAVVSNTSSLPELVAPEALFDPLDTHSMAAAIERALCDPEHRSRLLDRAPPKTTWDDIARRTVEVYDLFPLPSPPPRSSARRRTKARPRVAFITPLPPQPSGVADFSWHLLGSLAGLDVAVEPYVDGPPHRRADVLAAQAPGELRTRPLASLDRVEELTGAYDHVICSLGNSEYHTGALALLLRRPSIVLAHDVALTNLWRFAPWQHPQVAPEGLSGALRAMYGAALPTGLVSDEVTAEEIADADLPMARAAIRASSSYLVTSPFAASWARLDARPDDRHKVRAIPFAVGAIATSGRPPEPPAPERPLIVSFGVLATTKQPALVTEAVAGLTGARLVFVGPASQEARAVVERTAAERGSTDRVEITGEVDAATYRRWLEQATVAVQLRARTNGESSGAVGDCLTSGVPTVVTALGAARDLPPDAAATVPPMVSATELRTVLATIVADRGRRQQLADGGRRYAAAHTFDHTARALLEAVLAPPTAG